MISFLLISIVPHDNFQKINKPAYTAGTMKMMMMMPKIFTLLKCVHAYIYACMHKHTQDKNIKFYASHVTVLMQSPFSGFRYIFKYFLRSISNFFLYNRMIFMRIWILYYCCIVHYMKFADAVLWKVAKNEKKVNKIKCTSQLKLS